MTDTAATQLKRILAVIPRLADDREHAVADVAATIGVDVDTLRRDLWSLVTRFNEPGGFVDGVQLYLESDTVELISNHFRRPMRLSTSELCALELGLAILATQTAPDERAAIERARKTLRQIITRLGPDESVSALRHVALGSEGFAESLHAIRAALRSRTRLRMTYRKGDASEATVRSVSPYALIAARGTYYMVAHCDDSKGIRVFRIDRIGDVVNTGEHFEIPDSFSLDDVAAHGRVLHTDDSRTMTVRYSPRIARWIAEREQGEVGADGSVVVQHPLADMDWGMRHVLQYGPDAEVLEPAELRQAIADRLGQMLNA